MPQLKQEDLKRSKRRPKRYQTLFIDEETSDATEFKHFDYDFFIQCKETMKDLHINKNELGFNEKSMYLKMYQDLVKKREKRDSVFNRTLAVASEVKSGNCFWEQLPNNTVKHWHKDKPSKRKRDRMYQSMRHSSMNVWKEASRMDSDRRENPVDSKRESKAEQFGANIQNIKLSPLANRQKDKFPSNKFKHQPELAYSREFARRQRQSMDMVF